MVDKSIFCAYITDMQTNIIEISNNNRELTARRGFLCIKERGITLAEVPMDSICAVMATGRAILFTQNLMTQLCDNGIPLIIIGDNYNPVGIMTPLIGQTRQMTVQQTQVNSSKPLQKQLWKTIVQEKIRNQSRVLDYFGLDNKIKNLPTVVQSGDTSNIEGIAARMYFPALFGGGFLRIHTMGGINAFLNYGYAIIRGAMARLVVAAGLNPSYGIQHHNQLNPMCLVDDLMEPYRPIVDAIVYQIFQGSDDQTRELTPDDKRQMAMILESEIKTRAGFSPLINIMQRDVWNFVNSLSEKKNKLDFENVIQN
ncbi:MAG: type II CRISPR-associated endonuclease Cas1 [Alphaproteobacteria bacterium]|nr:type II CRISPR-associated endonuclease Cas1 [Alphaproteobacteria bacterium]